MANKNTSAFAGEFLVAGELSRRGYLVSITMGNAKSIDIFASTEEGVKIGIDVKASRYRTSWPIAKVDESLFYIFVYLQTEDKLKNDNKTRVNTSPEYYVVPGQDIMKNKLVEPWKSIPGIKYSSLQEYREGWSILPHP